MWTRKADMNTPRCVLGGVAASNGRIYAIGGDDRSPDRSLTQNTVEEYDPGSDTWTFSTSIPIEDGISYPGVVALDNGKFYVVSGQTPSIPLNTLYQVTIETTDATPPTTKAASGPNPKRQRLEQHRRGGNPDSH